MVGSNLYPSRLITSNVFQIALSAVIHNAVDGLGRGRALKNETEQARQENLRRMMITTTQNTSIASLHRVPMFPPKQFNTRFNGDSRSLSATNPNKHLFNVQNETMLAIGVLTASFICLVSIQVYRQVRMYRKRSARSRRDSQSVCDCAKIDEQLAELKRPPSAHRRQGAFDTLMVQECYYDRIDRRRPSSPPLPRSDVLHLSMSIVQVVHHGNPGKDSKGSSSEPEDRRDEGRTELATTKSNKLCKSQLAKILSDGSAEIRSSRETTTTIITVDESAEDVIKRIIDTAATGGGGGGKDKGQIEKSKKKKLEGDKSEHRQEESSVFDFKYKALKNDENLSVSDK